MTVCAVFPLSLRAELFQSFTEGARDFIILIWGGGASIMSQSKNGTETSVFFVVLNSYRKIQQIICLRNPAYRCLPTEYISPNFNICLICGWMLRTGSKAKISHSKGRFCWANRSLGHQDFAFSLKAKILEGNRDLRSQRENTHMRWERLLYYLDGSHGLVAL